MGQFLGAVVPVCHLPSWHEATVGVIAFYFPGKNEPCDDSDSASLMEALRTHKCPMAMERLGLRVYFGPLRLSVCLEEAVGSDFS
eukprot:1379355-Amphidinium_carterae.2